MAWLLEMRENANDEIGFFGMFVVHFLILHRLQEVGYNAFLHFGETKVDENASLSLF